MVKVKIFGAGSVGNHYAYACVKKKWKVTVVDIDSKALERMKKKIFPSRYGYWDKKIILKSKDNDDYYDLVMIGTPPESHLKIAIKELKKKNKPRIIQIEKPLTSPNLKYLDNFIKLKNKNKNVQIFGGYNHILTKNTLLAENIIKKNNFGKVLNMSARNREDWTTIFNAHFWFKSPKDSYLAYTSKGGGALCEHSHALSIWLHFANILKLGKVDKVSSIMKFSKKNTMNYDEQAFLILETEKNYLGDIIQDVVTFPPDKSLRIQFENGFLEWKINIKENYDSVKFQCKKKFKSYLIKKNRPDDFKGLVDHLGKALKNKNFVKNSPIAVDMSIKVIKIINKAIKSNNKKALKI